MKKNAQLILIIFFSQILFAISGANLSLTMGQTTASNKQIEKVSPSINASLSDTLIFSGIIISELILLTLIVVYWKKNKLNQNHSNKSNLKENIKKLRAEKILHRNNLKLNKVRLSLSDNLSKRKIDGSFITTKAKSLAVSKGEIYLAAKLNYLSGQKS